MVFLETADLKTYMFAQYIDESSADNVAAIEKIEKANVEFIKGKLASRFDVDTLFAQTGTDRSDLIIEALAKLTLYKLLRRNAARKVPEDIKDDYMWAKQWLDDVRDGKDTPPDFPLNEVSSTKLLYGSTKNPDFYI